MLLEQPEKSITIRMENTSNMTFNLSMSQVNRCEFLIANLSYRQNLNSEDNILDVHEDTYNILYDIFIDGNEPVSEIAEYLGYHRYDINYVYSRDVMTNIPVKPYQPKVDKETIAYRPTSEHWGWSKEAFNFLLNLLNSFIANSNENILIGGEAALIFYLNFPGYANEIGRVDIFYSGSDLTELTRFLTSRYNDVKYINGSTIKLNELIVQLLPYHRVEQAVNFYDIDCYSLVYVLKERRYVGLQTFLYAIENGHNTLYIDGERPPKKGYEARLIYALRSGFGIKIPCYSQFLASQLQDVNVYKEARCGAEIFYRFLIDNTILDNTQNISLGWTYQLWFSTRSVEKAPRLTLNSLSIFYPPFNEEEASSPIKNAFSNVPRNKLSRFNYNKPAIIGNIINKIPVVATGPGILRCLLSRPFNRVDLFLLREYNIMHALKVIAENFDYHALYDRDTYFSFTTPQQEIRMYKYPVSFFEALATNSFDFERVGYLNYSLVDSTKRDSGYLTDDIGYISLSKRLHFTKEDNIGNYELMEYGFRFVKSDNSILSANVSRSNSIDSS